MIIETVVTGSFEENTWILGDEQHRQAVIFDPGDNISNIISKINEHHLTPIFILNTHAHPDHLGAAAELQKRYYLPFAIHEDEVHSFNTAKNLGLMLGLFHLQLPKITNFLSDGQLLEINSLQLQVLHTPGHTPGSVCFLTGNHLFAGDTLFRGSIGRTDLPGGSSKKIMESLKKLRFLPAGTIVYPGHGEITTLEEELKSNPFLNGEY